MLGVAVVIDNNLQLAEIFIQGINRLREDTLRNIDVFAVVTNQSASKLCEKHGIMFTVRPKEPLGAQKNIAINMAWKHGADQILVTDPDTLFDFGVISGMIETCNMNGVAVIDDMYTYNRAKNGGIRVRAAQIFNQWIYGIYMLNREYCRQHLYKRVMRMKGHIFSEAYPGIENREEAICGSFLMDYMLSYERAVEVMSLDFPITLFDTNSEKMDPDVTADLRIIRAGSHVKVVEQEGNPGVVKIGTKINKVWNYQKAESSEALWFLGRKELNLLNQQ